MMPFFKKNPNESGYPGGKKHWVDIIKNTGPADALIWKQPEEDFNTNSTLIVLPGEASIFVNQGVVQQVFEAGSYQLSTENYPFISRLRNVLSGGISAFNCVVYFVKKSDTKELRWGTETPIQIRDKVWGVRVDIRARGAYRFWISDPVSFLHNLIGSNQQMQSQEDLWSFFAVEFQGKIKSVISKYLDSLNTEMIGIEAHMEDISKIIQSKFNEAIASYGIACSSFSIAALDIDKTKYEQLDEAQLELITRQKKYQADKFGLDMLGDQWSKVQGAEMLRDALSSPSIGKTASFGTDMALGLGMAGTVNSVSQQFFPPVAQAQMQPFHVDNAPISTQADKDPTETLKKLKALYEAELITQEDYDKKKDDILSRL